MIWPWIETSSAETGSSQTMKRRLERERARDADALALPAGELVRIALRHVGEQADLAQQRLDPLALRLAVGDQPVDAAAARR